MLTTNSQQFSQSIGTMLEPFPMPSAQLSFCFHHLYNIHSTFVEGTVGQMLILFKQDFIGIIIFWNVCHMSPLFILLQGESQLPFTCEYENNGKTHFTMRTLEP